MTSANPSSMGPYRESLIPGLVASILAHGGVAVAVALAVLFSQWRHPRPIIDPDNSIEVTIVSLPKSEKAVPDKASRAPVPQGQRPESRRPPPPPPPPPAPQT